MENNQPLHASNNRAWTRLLIMRSLYHFIVEPKGGERYDNTVDINGVDINISASNEDHLVTNRIAVVDKIPVSYVGPIKDGYEVVVHHNTFRLMKNMKGKETSSWGYLFNNKFMVEDGEVYAYRKPGEKWKAVSPFCFVEPIKGHIDGILPDHIDFNKPEAQLYGIMVYPNDDQKHIEPGTLVSYIPYSEYTFNIDGRKLYRMKTNMICLISDKKY